MRARDAVVNAHRHRPAGPCSSPACTVVISLLGMFADRRRRSSTAWPSARIVGRAARDGRRRSRCCRRCSASSGTRSTGSRMPGLHRQAADRQHGSGTAGAASSSADRWPSRRSSASRVLVVLAIPVLVMRLGFADAGNDPTSAHHPPGLRPAGRGLRARLQRPAAWSPSTCPTAADREAARRARRRGHGRDRRRRRVVRPGSTRPGDAAMIIVIPTVAAGRRAPSELVARTCATTSSRRRSQGTGAAAYVGGFTAAGIDSPTTFSAAAAVCSSAPWSCCRSCC